MGFFENWLADKVGISLGRGTGLMQPATAGGPNVGGASATPAAETPNARVRANTEPVIRDFTKKPNIDPEMLKKIMPRDGDASLTVSGLDGVLTVGVDMVMTTDQPIHCETIRVLGTLEATVHAHKIIIAEGGAVCGSVRVVDAEIRGTFDGSLQARGRASIHSKAVVTGKVRAADISISKEAKIEGADIKRVVQKSSDDLANDYAGGARFDEGNSSMCITVSQRSALRR